jgi:hypothetical protein
LRDDDAPEVVEGHNSIFHRPAGLRFLSGEDDASVILELTLNFELNTPYLHGQNPAMISLARRKARIRRHIILLPFTFQWETFGGRNSVLDAEGKQCTSRIPFSGDRINDHPW